MRKLYDLFLKIIRSKLLISFAGILVLALLIRLFSFSVSVPYKDDERFHNSFRHDYRIFALDIPSDLSFAGEQVPLDDFEVLERFDREFLINTYWQSQTLLFIKNANRWFPMIEPILKEYSVPDDFKYIPLIESGLLNKVSPVGATGPWQFMKKTAIKYGLEVNGQVDERYHLEKATVAACKYILDAKKYLGSWTLAAASYNAGMGTINNQMKRQKADNYYDLLLVSETARYVFRLLAIKEIFSNPGKYGFYFRRKDLYQNIETYEVEVDSSVSNFADFAAHFNIGYKMLKFFNPWLRDSFLKNQSGKKYYIRLPKAGALSSVKLESIFPDSMLFDGSSQPEPERTGIQENDSPGNKPDTVSKKTD